MRATYMGKGRLVFTIVLVILIIASLITIYTNELRYIEIYKAISGVNIRVEKVELYNLNDTPKIYVKILVSNPSKLDIRVLDIGGHIKLNNVYIGEVRFVNIPKYIGRESRNVSLTGVYEATSETIGYIKRSYESGKLKWSIYGWASFEVYRQRLMIEFRGEYGKNI